MDLSKKLVELRARLPGAQAAVVDAVLHDAELFAWFERKVRVYRDGRGFAPEMEPPPGVWVLKRRSVNWHNFCAVCATVFGEVRE